MRMWPSKNHTLVFEDFDEQGRLRAGRILADGSKEYAEFSRDKKLPELAPSDATLLVHRYGKRAVVHHGEAITKYTRPGKAVDIARKSTIIRNACRNVGLGAAAVTATTDGSVTFSLLPGATLHTLGDCYEGWDEFFRLWPQLMHQEVDVPAFTAADEAATLRDWMAKARQFGRLPDIEAESESVIERLHQASDPSVLLHRDLYDKQLMWDGTTLSVLDLDTAARGEGALDIGNVLAHVYLRRMQGVISPEFAEYLINRLENFPGVSEHRLNTYFLSSALRLSCVYAFRPNSSSWLARWIDFTKERASS